MSQYRRIILGSILTAVSQVVTILTTLIITPIILDILGTGRYGVWILIGSAMSYLMVLDMGMIAAGRRYLAGHLGEKNDAEFLLTFNLLVRIYLFLALVSLALVSVVYIVFMDYETNLVSSAEIAVAVTCLAASLAVRLAANPFLTVLVVHLRYDLLNVLGVLSTLSRAILMYWSLTHGYGIIGLAVSTVAVDIVHFACWVLLAFYEKRDLRVSTRFPFERDRAKKLLNFSMSSFVTHMSNQTCEYLGTWTSGYLGGPHLAAKFSIGSRLINIGSAFVNRPIDSLSPIYASLAGAGRMDELRQLYRRTNHIAFLAGAYAMMPVFFIGDDFIRSWVGPEFDVSYPVMCALSIRMAAVIWEKGSHNVALALNQQWLVTKIAVAEVILVVVLIYPGYLWNGIVGIAVVVGASGFLVRAVVMSLMVASRLSLPLKESLLSLPRPALVSLGCAAIAYYADQLLSYDSLVILMAINAPIYGVLGVVLINLGLMPEDRRLLREAMPRKMRLFLLS